MKKQITIFMLTSLTQLNAMVAVQTKTIAQHPLGNAQADINKKFIEAIKSGSIFAEEKEEWFKQGVSPDAQDEDGTPALILAAQANTGLHAMCLTKVLLDHKANVNAQDAQGNTALMSATRIKREYIAAALLAHGADIYIKNNDNKSYYDVASAPFIRSVKAYLAEWLSPQKSS